MSGRFGAVCLLAVVAGWASAAPDILIAEVKRLSNKDGRPLSLAPYVAEELDKDGRVRPVVWSLSDPVFREWSAKDIVGGLDPEPDQRQVLETGRRLGVPYVLIVQTELRDNGFLPQAELFHFGRAIWKFGPRNPKKGSDIVVSTEGKYDEKATRELQARVPDLIRAGSTFTVYVAGVPDWDATARACASSWAALMAESPLAKLASRPRTDTAPVNSGTDAAAGNHVDIDVAQVPLRVKDLMALGDFLGAVALAREACDKDPLNVEVRLLLCRSLLAAGFYQECAETSQALGRLRPQSPEPWLLGAEAWIRSGNAERAAQALALAESCRASTDALVRLRADLALLKNDLPSARDTLVALKDPGSQIKLALVHALLGEPAQCEAVMKGLPPVATDLGDYVAVIGFVDRALPRLVEIARGVVPACRVRPGTDESMTQARESAATTKALLTLVSGMVAPKGHNESHEARKLAHIMLSQAQLEALHFAETNDPETAEEAIASLGQALRLMSNVQELFRLERLYPRS